MESKNICKNCKFWEAYKGDFVKITYRYHGSSEIYTGYMLKSEEERCGNDVLSREEIKDMVRNIGHCKNDAKFIYDDPESLTISDDPDAKYRDDALYYFDGGWSDELRYSASFCTGEKFGCIHFEQKEQKGEV
jgi:hypothetical protein